MRKAKTITLQKSLALSRWAVTCSSWAILVLLLKRTSDSR